MSHTLTIRLSQELAEWLAEVSRTTGLPTGRIIRQLLETAKAETGKQPFLRLAGQIEGPPTCPRVRAIRGNESYRRYGIHRRIW